jgi:Fur family peroxide stress response transcriptional regulator
MRGPDRTDSAPEINVRLAHCGLRFTPQRQHVYDVLLSQRDHPTAEEVFLRAKKGMPDISMATVYNCLDALVQCGLAKQVNVDRSATRFCPNMREHGHFYCEGCGGIFDVAAAPGAALRSLSLPRGFRVTQMDVAVRGLCGDCHARENA